jgi:hypothetical protein
MMKILIFFIIVVSFAACRNGETEVSIVEAESWTDLMPGTPGKTYLQITFSISGNQPDEIDVSSLKVSWKNGNYTLSKNEIEYNVKKIDSNNTELGLRGVFLLGDKDIDQMNAEVEFTFDGRNVLHKTDSITVEKVY